MPAASSLGFVRNEQTVNIQVADTMEAALAPPPKGFMQCDSYRSRHSALSVMSFGSLLSTVGIFSWLSFFSFLSGASGVSIASLASFGSVLSTTSILSIFSTNSILSIGCDTGFMQVCI